MIKKPWPEQKLYGGIFSENEHIFNPSAVRKVESLDEYALPIMPYLVQVGTVPQRGEPEDRLKQLFRADKNGVKKQIDLYEKNLREEFGDKISSLKEISFGVDNLRNAFYVQFTTDEPLTEQDHNTIYTILTNTEQLDFLDRPDIGFSRYQECGPVETQPYTWKLFGWQNIMDPWAVKLEGKEGDTFKEAEILMETGYLNYRIDIPEDGLEFPVFSSDEYYKGPVVKKFSEAMAGYGAEHVHAMTYGDDCSADMIGIGRVTFSIPYDNKIVDVSEIADRLAEAKAELIGKDFTAAVGALENSEESMKL